MKIPERDDLETIDPRPRAPWKELPFEQVEIIQDRDEALARAEELGNGPRKVIFTDASAKDSQLGAAVVILGSRPWQRRTRQVGIGPATRWNIHLAELMAICYATTMIQDVETQMQPRENMETALSNVEGIKK